MFAELLVNFIRVTSGSTDTQLKELVLVNGYLTLKRFTMNPGK